LKLLVILQYWRVLIRLEDNFGRIKETNEAEELSKYQVIVSLLGTLFQYFGRAIY
jgi:hypothetical protein